MYDFQLNIYIIRAAIVRPDKYIYNLEIWFHIYVNSLTGCRRHINSYNRPYSATRCFYSSRFLEGDTLWLKSSLVPV